MAWESVRARDVRVGDVVFATFGPRRVTRAQLMPKGRPLLRGPLAHADTDDVAFDYWDGYESMGADHWVRVQTS